MSLKTSNLPFKQRVEHEVHNLIMRKAVVKAQETIGANRQRMVDELGHWEEWRDLAKQIRNHVLANLDAYLYQLSEKVLANGGHVYFAETAEQAAEYIRQVALAKKAKKS
ncbi:conserved domain protein [Haemophilus pittmaniae HK 85]|uniref:Conserved domain protein n=1 Tax=Haemophilus pittmaniae HK 85 TaxID=1035188 RepID=F9Q6Q6_9PAST|nr:conserved domain protein [Haemophilus pittmaniae HK 85]